MINTYDQLNSTCPQNSGYNSPYQSLYDHLIGMTRLVLSVHLTPSKNKRRIRNKEASNHVKNGIVMNVEEKQGGRALNALTTKSHQ